VPSKPSSVLTFRQTQLLIKEASAILENKGFSSPKTDVEWLLETLLDCSRSELYEQGSRELTDTQWDKFNSWFQRRLNREPVQYITGWAEFYGRRFTVTPAVLIPRPETERLVDVALHAMGGDMSPRILDAGTGSGCVALSLAKELPHAEIIALDVSEEALDIARKNAQDLKVKNVTFKKRDILSHVPEGSFDLIVSNPPYIPADEIPILMPEIQEYEPHMALTDHADGLTFYRRLAYLAPWILSPGGWIVMEVGLGDHPQQARAVFQAEGFKKTALIKDYNGDERVLRVGTG
jgi:release factor glutamine methyltransferase